MFSSRPERARLRWIALASAVVAGAALAGPAILNGSHGDRGLAAFGFQAVPPATDAPPGPPPGGHDEPGRRQLAPRGLGASGRVPDDVTVFDGQIPAVAKLDPALLSALRRAAMDAADDKVTFHVTSGWRSAEYQEQLLRDAMSEYGPEEAARWVATPEKSAHVSGDAVDLGPVKAETWLSKHGAAYGLCQIYRNEPWHYELRPDAPDHGCPPTYADPTEDPRMK